MSQQTGSQQPVPQQTKRLDPLSFPLSGSALIEASAGTGKTYTLALLYLRLVLQHGGDSRFPDYLLPPNILVVTFTKAATRELRDRIRARLVEAAAYFRGDLEDTEVDAQLHRLKQDVTLEQDLNAAAKRLDVAAEWMDEAAVSTIHSWCSRVLSEHAFYSGLNFSQKLVENEKPIVVQSCEDYWRENVFTLDEPELRQVLGCFASPMKLYQQIEKLIYQTDAIAQVEPDLAQELSAMAKRRAEAITALKQSVLEALPVLQQGFEDAAKQKLFKGTSLNASHRKSVYEGLTKWIESSGDGLDLLKDLFKGKSFAKIALLDTSFWNDSSHIPIDRAAAQALVTLQENILNLETPLEYLICHATHWVAEQVAHEKDQRGVLSQNDLLSKLDQALNSQGKEYEQGKEHGLGGERLAEVIRKQFPVALVDEFQDTDPVQYRIFNAIYNVAEPYPETGFFMIGDPKQAIYRFRGADIFTYLSAKQDTCERQYTLTHNFRSAPSLVDKVNRYFAHADQSSAQGAFLFKQDIPFLAVQAGKKDNIELCIQGQRQPEQCLWDLPAYTEEGEENKWNRAEVTAKEVAHLLNLSARGEATINLGEGTRAIQPKDFAILVNNGTQAKEIRRALFALNVSSVYLSDSNDVYDSDEAQDVLRILCAMAEPFNSFHLRIALGTRLLGMSLVDLDRLNRDEVYWEQQIELFRRYHLHWLEFGVMAALHRLFTEQNVAARYLAGANGERSITDLFHIAELLQQASETIQGQQALIHHLEQCITSEKSGDEATQQRLESDADLVQVVTVHKSKGLQYPLVMLPYLDHVREVKAKDASVEYHQDNGQLTIAFQPNEQQLVMADRERLAEDVRKIYVAMTRAICAQWVAIEEPKTTKANPAPPLIAAAHVLAGRLNGSVVEQYRAMEDVFQCVHPQEDVPPYQPEDSGELRAAREVSNLGLSPWWVSSYSSFTFGAKEALESLPESTATERPVDEQRMDDDTPEVEVNLITSKSHKLMHRLPRGSHIGIFLHGLIEWAAVQRTETDNGVRLSGFSAAVADEAKRIDMLQARCRKRGLQQEVEPISDWLVDFLHHTWRLDRLPNQDTVTFRLVDLAPQDIAVEMEFMFAANQVHSQRLDELVRQHTWKGVERPVASYQSLQGMFKGFIDMVAQINGQYYVIDWKSNALGEHDDAYHEDALQDALLKKRYDLQYVLYLVALHRHLKDRIPDYDYDTHVGGAVYYFLRGYEHPQTQGLIMDKPNKQLIESLDRMFAGTLAQEVAYV